jgi:methionyl-tRNA formyltransferase
VPLGTAQEFLAPDEDAKRPTGIMEPLKIIFAGTPDFSVPCLNALLDADNEVVAVYTQPDRPAGRGRKLTASPVKEAALTAGLSVFQPETLKSTDAVEALRGHNADLMVVVAYGLLLPQGVLDAPRLGCVNVHASLLPRWRGAAPIQRAILAGDRESGVTIMGMEAGLDTGPMYLVRKLLLDPRETGGSLHDKLSLLGAEALVESLPGIADGTLVPDPQDEDLATYAKKLTKDQARIDWHRSSAEIDRLVRAFDPWPVAQTGLGDARFRIWSGEPVQIPTGDAKPGTVISESKAGIDVAAGDGVLRITRLQPPGKRPMSAAEFLNARSLEGEVLG